MSPARNLNDVLVSIYRDSCDNAELLNLVRFLAEQIRTQHDQGHWLQTLSNEKLWLTSDADGCWSGLSFDRGHNTKTLSLSMVARADSVSNLDLPDDYWRIFKHIYFHDQAIPPEFEQHVQQQRQFKPTTHGFCKKNIWLWDENSAQAMIVLHRQAKNFFRKKRDALKLIGRVLWSLPKLYFAYRSVRHQAFRKTVSIKDRIGVALHTPYWSQEKKLLTELGNIPTLVRFYAHQSAAEWRAGIEHVKALAKTKVQVTIALVQDRKSVTERKHWQQLLEAVLPTLHEDIVACEVGHAVNRVKWGIWQAEEYAHLVQLVAKYQQQYPKLALLGPAVIDFEWYRLLDFLNVLPRNFRFQGLSQHLYVDRRGAPENFQGKYSTLEKCAMGRAVAKTNRHSADRYVISEVNWPVKNTGIHSPIGSPYTAPEWFRDLPGEDLETYANYLIRYLAITLCSGFVDQVFIWRLSAHGYGLVDDLNDFQKRPAYTALKTFLQLLGDAQFVQRHASDKNAYVLEFKLADKPILLTWCVEGECELDAPFVCSQVITRDGEVTNFNAEQLRLTSMPRYYC